MQLLSRAIALGFVVAAPFFASSAAAQQDYPSRPVKIIVPFGAGGPADVFARQLAQHLSDTLKQSFVVENRPGAGSIIGTDAVAKSPPDGYTLLLMSNTHTTNELLTPNKPFQLMRDFVPVAAINYSDLVMVVHPSVPAKDLKEFIALAKKEPGKLNYGSSGIRDAVSHGRRAVQGHERHRHRARSAQGIGRDAQRRDRRARADGVRRRHHHDRERQGRPGPRARAPRPRKRSTVLPDVPTVAEAGVPGYEATIWLGIMAPAGTPKAVVDKLNAEINKTIGKPEVKAAWDKQGAVALTMTPAQFDAYLRKDIEKWAAVVKAAGLAK